MSVASEELEPVALLKFIRDGDEVDVGAIVKQFRIGEGGTTAELLRLREIVGGLEQAGLVVQTRDSQLGVSLSSSASPESESTAWRVTTLVKDVQQSLGLSLTELAEFKAVPHTEEARALDKRAARILEQMPSQGFKDDLVASLREIAKCLRARCYIATLGLCGKVLEIAIKRHLILNGVKFGDTLGLGRLLEKLRTVEGTYVDPSVKQHANMINAARIPAVHAKNDIPVPSEHQAVMIVRATLDMIDRLVLQDLDQTLPTDV